MTPQNDRNENVSKIVIAIGPRGMGNLIMACDPFVRAETPAASEVAFAVADLSIGSAPGYIDANIVQYEIEAIS